MVAQQACASGKYYTQEQVDAILENVKRNFRGKLAIGIGPDQAAMQSQDALVFVYQSKKRKLERECKKLEEQKNTLEQECKKMKAAYERAQEHGAHWKKATEEWEDNFEKFWALVAKNYEQKKLDSTRYSLLKTSKAAAAAAAE